MSRDKKLATTVRRWSLHAVRLAMFLLVIGLVHFKHQQRTASAPRTTAPPLDLLLELYPQADSVSDEPSTDGRWEVLGSDDQALGYVLQTAPTADHIIGFSGPTNTLIAFGPDDRICGVRIRSSRDTAEHVRQVEQSKVFFEPYIGRRRDQLAGLRVDAVSGATLTSLAIQEGILHRIGGLSRSLRFPEPLQIADALPLFPEATSLQQDADDASLWHVLDKQGVRLGQLLRTSPEADRVIGYQGPTETLIALSADGRVTGMALRKSFDNQPYVGYVSEDAYFLSLFNGLDLESLARRDLEQDEVEGVSGATMTSQAMAEGLVAAARRRQAQLSAPPAAPWWQPMWSWRDLGTAAVIGAGLVIGMTSLRGNKPLRWCFQLLLIGYLGLLNGDMLSQAMLVGWAQNGIPWRSAGGLLCLTIAAFVVPLTTRRNIYCSHLCPHGAVQQLVMKRLPWQLRIRRGTSGWLRLLPVLLLAWCIIVPMCGLAFSLIDIEPFDAWVFYVAGAATIVVAVVGLVASLFVPMAYCRFGCPTGTLLDYLRLNQRSDRWTRRDALALGLLLLAAACWFV